MGNPFTPKSEGLLSNLPKPRRAIFNWNIHNAESTLKANGAGLEKAHKMVDALGTAPAPEALTKEVDAVHRAFNKNADRLAFAEGKMGASIKGMFVSMGDAVGLDTSKWHSTKIKGAPAEAVEKALSVRGSVFERVASKPFRVVANHPRAALAAGAALAVAGIGSAISNGNKKRSEAEVTQKVAQAQGQYMNSVSPQEAAAMDAAMKAGGNGSFADAAQQRSTGPATAAL